VSNTVSHKPITCPSCEYRYSSGNAICPMCGTAAPAVEPPQTLSRVPDEFSGADNQFRPLSSDGQKSPSHPALRRLIPVVVVSIVFIMVSSVFYEVHKRNLAKESGSAGELTSTSELPKAKNADQRRIVRDPVRRVQHATPAKLGTAKTPDTAKEDDPIELWKAVKRGNVSAEVALANLYLQGKSVPQNCEQAHMLLQTASMKGSEAADTLLNGSYAKRCE
jgi:hypothetical protein